MIVNLIRHWFFGHYTTRVTRKAVRRLIRKMKPAANLRQRNEILHRIDQAAAAHRQDDASLVIDPPSRGHLEWASLILAAYQELLSDFASEEETIQALGSEMEAAHGTPMILFTLDRLMKAFRGDVRRAGKVLDAVLKQYGDSFAWESEVDEKGLTFTITRCWYFHFFNAHGLPRLTTCACRLDGLWFNRMDPKRHGLRFDQERYTTKGYGSENCIFPIERG
jgi:hypothetical protein